MSELVLYHGSQNKIERPVYGYGKVYNDYGLGFYLTENVGLAKEWACIENLDGYANKYVINLDELSILNLSSNDYTVLNWLSILIYNRDFKISTPLAKKAKEYLIKYFMPDYEKYDIIVGYRADDSYFLFAKAFLNNQISLKQFNYAMSLGKLGLQYVLKSKKAFDSIKYIDSFIADNRTYWPKKKARDDEVRNKFLDELGNEDLKGIFIRDILNEEMKENDPRLR